jgi:nucleoside-diphosphate-sugar epimerase
MRAIDSIYKDKIVAITGAGGYIAGAIIAALKKTPAKIIRVSRRDLEEDNLVTSLKLDVQTRECWDEIVNRADIIIHLAGNTSIYTAAKDPADSLNSTVLPLTHLIAAAQKAGRKPRVVYASTATVYGINNKGPLREDVLPDPTTTYDLHKVFAEKQLKFASEKEIIEGVSLRLANVYGPSPSKSTSDDRGILNKITRFALAGKDIQLYGDGNYLRDYIYIGDVVSAFLTAGIAENVSGNSFNVATGRSVTVREAFHMVVDQVKKIAGKEVVIHTASWPENVDPIELRDFVACTSNFKELAGWSSTVTIENGINMMIKSFNTGKID